MSAIMDSSSATYATDLALADVSEVPMSRTHQYRKVMKPLLERKRRARINKCLDELKDLMVDALQSEGESISKLEKADVLELTVTHLQKLKSQNRLRGEPDRYLTGFAACASEVSQCLASQPGVDPSVGSHLMNHLGLKLKGINSLSSPLTVAVPSPNQISKRNLSTASSSSSVASVEEPMDLKVAPGPFSDGGYSSGRESVSPRSLPSPQMVKREIMVPAGGPVWRPF